MTHDDDDGPDVSYSRHDVVLGVLMDSLEEMAAATSAKGGTTCCTFGVAATDTISPRKGSQNKVHINYAVLMTNATMST